MEDLKEKEDQELLELILMKEKKTGFLDPFAIQMAIGRGLYGKLKEMRGASQRDEGIFKICSNCPKKIKGKSFGFFEGKRQWPCEEPCQPGLLREEELSGESKEIDFSKIKIEKAIAFEPGKVYLFKIEVSPGVSSKTIELSIMKLKEILNEQGIKHIITVYTSPGIDISVETEGERK